MEFLLFFFETFFFGAKGGRQRGEKELTLFLSSLRPFPFLPF